MSKSHIKMRPPSEAMLKMGAPVYNSNSRTSNRTQGRVTEIYHIDVEKLVPFRGQVRKSFNEEAIKGLSQTILEHGIRQPLSVIKSDKADGTYEVVSGERRLRAAKVAGLSKVPCQIIQNISDAEEISLIENVQREDLHPIELGRGYLRLKEKFFFTQEKIAEKLGVPRTQVVEYISFSKMPDEVANKALELKVSGRAILRRLLKCRRGDMLEFLESVSGQEKKSDKTSLSSKKPVIRKSFLKVDLLDHDLKVTMRDAKLLDEAQKARLREILTGILKDL